MMVKKAKDPAEIIRFASMWNMDGLVVLGFCSQDYTYLRNHMRIPFVVYDGFCENPERIFNITIDNYDGGFQVGQYFRNSGHKKALCISDNDIDVDRERYNGFRDGFGNENTELLLIPMYKKERRKYHLQNLHRLCSVTAIFAVSDYYAIDLMRFLYEKGLRIPDDISIAGFDDIPMCEMICPSLTTVKQDGAMRAEIAIQKLWELKENKETETSVMLPVTLIERDSTRKTDKEPNRLHL